MAIEDVIDYRRLNAQRDLRETFRRSCEELGTVSAESEEATILQGLLRGLGGHLLMASGVLDDRARERRKVSSADLVLVKSSLRSVTEAVERFERACRGSE